MNIFPHSVIRFIVLAVAVTTFIGCSEKLEHEEIIRHAIAIERGEECHLCGMVIEKFPGPKGQLYQRGTEKTRKFCSTRDMFAYLLDPEYRHQIQQAYVHNMALTPWKHPKEDTYIDAKAAWYVIGHIRKGAMGPTLATFKLESEANIFAKEFGGKLYSFNELTIDVISTMKEGSHG